MQKIFVSLLLLVLAGCGLPDWTENPYEEALGTDWRVNTTFGGQATFIDDFVNIDFVEADSPYSLVSVLYKWGGYVNTLDTWGVNHMSFDLRINSMDPNAKFEFLLKDQSTYCRIDAGEVPIGEWVRIQVEYEFLSWSDGDTAWDTGWKISTAPWVADDNHVRIFENPKYHSIFVNIDDGDINFDIRNFSVDWS